jgi:hypothetical protein
MAGIMLIGAPFLGAALTAPILQAGLRYAGVGLTGRVIIELALIAFGVCGTLLFPPGSARDGKNWGKTIIFVYCVSLGVWTMGDGLLMNTIQGIYAMIFKSKTSETDYSTN